MAIASTLLAYLVGLTVTVLIWAGDLSLLWSVVAIAGAVWLWTRLIKLLRAERGRGDEISDEIHHTAPQPVPPSPSERPAEPPAWERPTEPPPVSTAPAPR